MKPGLNPEKTQSDTPTEKLRDVVAGFIDVVTTQGERALDAIGIGPGTRRSFPVADVCETNDQIIVEVDLPGVAPHELEILLVGNMLTIKGALPASPERPGRTVHRHERPGGRFSRSWPLPVAVNPERVSASSQHGVLTVTLAKDEQSRPRQIRVHVSEPAPGE